MRHYGPITKDIRMRTNQKETLSKHSKELCGQQYEMTFDVQAEASLRMLLRQENKASLGNLIND